MMAGRGELRVVKCPKCESLLPGKVDYAVFRCGGCGAILRAGKSKPGDGGSDTTVSLKSDEQENCIGSVTNKSEKGMLMKNNDAASDINNSDHRQVKSSGERRRRIISDNIRYSDDHTTIQNWVTAADGRSSLDIDNDRRRYDRSDLGGYVEKWMNDSNLDDEAISSSSSSSYCHSAEFYHGHEMKNSNFMGDYEAADKIRHIENHEQAEILRKLDEIKDHLINRQSAVNNVAELDRANDKLRPLSRRAIRPPNYGHHNCTTSVSSSNKPYDKPAISPFSTRDTHHEYHHDPTNAAAAAYPQIIKPPNIHRVPRYGLDVPSKSGSVASDVQRTARSTHNNRCSRPIFGAAPFIICPCCFELLQLPNKSKKFRCGACSSTLRCAVSHHKKLLVSVQEETKEAATLDLQRDNKFAEKGFATSSLGHVNKRDSKNSSHFSSSEDFNRSAYEFHSMDSSSRCPPKQILSGDTETETTLSSIDQSELVSSVKLPPSPPAGSTLQELFDYSTIFHRTDKFDKGSRSRSRSSDDNGKVLGRKTISSKPEFLEKQADTSLQYSNTVVSHDSCGSTTREDDDEARKNCTKGLKYYSKESSSVLSRSSSQDQENEDDGGIVTVNGYVIPDHLVKKAERMSGPIQPGDYWYDFRAGFWGVMDGPSLGIIPPAIEEFNYRMQEKCSCGNTGVYVNGRELHQKDLEMLGSRGLPTAPHKSYIVEISGKVWDEESGEELFTMRKLAPTVEKLNRGFGIRVPKMS